MYFKLLYYLLLLQLSLYLFCSFLVIIAIERLPECRRYDYSKCYGRCQNAECEIDSIICRNISSTRFMCACFHCGQQNTTRVKIYGRYS